MKKEKIKVGLIIFIILTICFSKITLGTEENFEKSEAYKSWEKLSEKDKKEYIEPIFSDIELENSIKKSTLYNLRSNDDNLEPIYDLRSVLQNNLNVKNQQKTGSCWAFSYVSALETTMANKYKKTGLLYSPMHINYKTSQIFNRSLASGGNSHIATAYVVSGNGPVYESDLPFDSVYNETENSSSTDYLKTLSNDEINKTVRARVKDVKIFPNLYKYYDSNTNTIKYGKNSSILLTYTDEEVNSIRTLIKKHIKECGAVTAMINSKGLKESEQSENKYNTTTKAFCNLTYSSPDHNVTIVGWNDGFSKDNFPSSNRPVHDGAYIVLNSWGTSFGENGYFYISYDDITIEQAIFGINDMEENNEKESYDKLYQYDQLGCSCHIPAKNNQNQYLNAGYLANVFTREIPTDKKEYLSEVGVYLWTTEGIEIYVNPNGDNLNECELVSINTGNNALEAGYHTIKLASPIELKGNKFVIKVKYINSEKSFLPLECNLEQSGLSNSESMFSTATANLGESYISLDGNDWTDINQYTYTELNKSYSFKNSNACIKAFSTYSDINTQEETQTENVKVTGIILNKNSISIKKGNTYSLIATVLPENAKNKNITWNTEDSKIATVENGVVTAVDEGKTNIVVTTQDGNYSEKCSVDVIIDTETNNDETNEENNKQDEENNEDNNYVKVTGISLNKTKHTMQVGDKGNLTATITPTNATYKNVTWSSSNPEVATISSTGMITALKEGTTIITAKTQNEIYEATCELTITKKTTSVDDIYDSDSSENDDYEDEDEYEDEEDIDIASISATKQNSNTGSKITLLPNTGKNGIVLSIAFIFVVISVYSYFKIKKLKNVK